MNLLLLLGYPFLLLHGCILLLGLLLCLGLVLLVQQCLINASSSSSHHVDGGYVLVFDH